MGEMTYILFLSFFAFYIATTNSYVIVDHEPDSSNLVETQNYYYEVVKLEPCHPSPCGPNSECRNVNGQPVCSCLTGFIGSPPLCRPECTVSSDCLPDEACSDNKCTKACPGACGVEAICQVIKHNAICSCPNSYTGDPFIRCIALPFEEESYNPCIPSPCGPNSICKELLGLPSCSCMTAFVGSPPHCKPKECISNLGCPTHQACINNECRDACDSDCGNNTQCQVMNHSVSCSCLSGFTGDPSSGCHSMTPVQEVASPCQPSPCGANSICKEQNGTGSCTCLPDYFGNPYEGCRPECLINTDCPSNKACLHNKCRDPCPGACGPDLCHVFNHSPACIPDESLPPNSPCQPSPCGANAICKPENGYGTCTCLPNYFGNPYENCRPECLINTDECQPSPCGPNSRCQVENGVPICSCLPNYIGTPPRCRPECTASAECSKAKACINQTCQDPCLNACGINSDCSVINHNPICQCKPQYTGDPFSMCSPIPHISEEEETLDTENSSHPTSIEMNLKCGTVAVVKPETCHPSPCGPNSECRDINGQPECSCLTGFIGSPPTCRPECTVSSDCLPYEACSDNKCINPCSGLGACGDNALCEVKNRIAVCSCPVSYTGDPMIKCIAMPFQRNPCYPSSPCGPNSICKEFLGGWASCSCIPGYVGHFPHCKPKECNSDSECLTHQACINQKCFDPCVFLCGVNTQCHVTNHSASCSCLSGFTGNPSSECYSMTPVQEVASPCQPSPCGANAICKELNGTGSCTCPLDYFGNPYEGCRPECLVNSDCPSYKACLHNKCRNPCLGVCSSNNVCDVVNHSPRCVPKESYYQKYLCEPSPCGRNSICRVENEVPICSCLPNYIGTPPRCRPECTTSAECSEAKACINQTCQDPCLNACGINSDCNVIDDIPICQCKPQYTGDPFSRCSPIQHISEEKETLDSENSSDATSMEMNLKCGTVAVVKPEPCHPSPCGPNSECRDINGQPVCSCLTGFIGSPPTCRPECTVSSDCLPDEACSDNKCIKLCPGACGVEATCQVKNHHPVCSCPVSHTGDPIIRCIAMPVEHEAVNLCYQSTPCGPNSICKVFLGLPSCSCIPGFVGPPPHCKPKECISDSGCPTHQACINHECLDPCIFLCGVNTECPVTNHFASCSCLSGFTGNPTSECHKMTPVQEVVSPCQPSPCGANAICKEENGSSSCTCPLDYFGNPYEGCRPECLVNSDCPSYRACLQNKCRDPCPGDCGPKDECHVVHHYPRCVPDESYDPNDFCKISPCGPHSLCRVENEVPICSCLPNYIGTPPRCRPECTTSAECSEAKACINQTCQDPCINACGINSDCRVINDNPICQCKPQYTGDPFSRCSPIPHTPEEKETSATDRSSDSTSADSTKAGQEKSFETRSDPTTDDVSNECGTDTDYKFFVGTEACYKLYSIQTDRETWDYAEATCVREGGHLAVINSQDEADFFVTLMRHLPQNAYQVFLGFHRKQGSWVTLQGLNLSETGYENWKEGEPNNIGGDQSCGSMYPDGTFDDIECWFKLAFICERSSNSEYQPDSTTEVHNSFETSDSNTDDHTPDDDSLHNDTLVDDTPNDEESSGMEDLTEPALVKAESECGTADTEYTFYESTQSCYKVHIDRATWNDAEAACVREGGHLAVINSQDEADVLTTLYPEGAEHVFVGFSYREQESPKISDMYEIRKNGVWLTIDDKTLAEAGYENWTPGEPNNTGGMEYCGTIYGNGKFDDKGCFNEFDFICEIKHKWNGAH